MSFRNIGNIARTVELKFPFWYFKQKAFKYDESYSLFDFFQNCGKGLIFVVKYLSKIILILLKIMGQRALQHQNRCKFVSMIFFKLYKHSLEIINSKIHTFLIFQQDLFLINLRLIKSVSLLQKKCDNNKL